MCGVFLVDLHCQRLMPLIDEIGARREEEEGGFFESI
jgi:hypothetical protein